MTEVSTTATDNQEDNLDPNATDQQTADTSDNLATSNNDQGTTDNDTATANGDEGKDDQGSKTPATFDDDLDDWISKRGLVAETDEAKTALQELRNGQREFTREQQAKKDSEALATSLAEERKGLDPEEEEDEDDPLAADVKALKAERDAERTIRLQSEFYTENKVSDVEHKAILDIIKEKVARPTTKEGKLQALDLWSSPNALPDLLDLAKARVFKSSDTSSTEEAAVKAERERIAKESNANSSPRGAKTTTTGNKTPEQERLERFTQW